MIKLYLWCTLVGLVLVGLCYDVFWNCSPINARSDCEAAYRLMSGTDGDTILIPPSSGSSSTGLLNDTRSVSCGLRLSEENKRILG